MKKICFIFVILVIVGGLAAQDWSGVLDGTVNYTAGAGDAEEHSFGLENYANLRLRVRTRERATFHAAFNLIAVSGNFLRTADMLGGLDQNTSLISTPFVYGQNYAAAMELERLYVRIVGEHVDTEAGLLRMNFGYGNVWASSDFLNPRNPLALNARPRGVLGFNSSFYPTDTLRLMAFAAAPKNPLESGGGGFIPGVLLDQHWNRASLQGLYAYETPLENISPMGIHRFGLSLKADMELGFLVDALYTLNPETVKDDDDFQVVHGLSMGAGFDYSFLGGDLYVLAEYLYNGSSSVSSFNQGGNWINNHFLYGSALYRFNDFFTMSLSTIFCFDDLSFQPILSADYEIFQGFSMNLNARLPMDQKTMNGGKVGELGPIPPGPDGIDGTTGAKFIFNVGARLRF